MGMRYLTDGNYEEAIIAFTAAIEIDPKRAEAYVGRGDAYANYSDLSDGLILAQEDYKKVIELDPTNISVYLSLADIYVALGQYEAGIETLKAALSVFGDNQDIQSKLSEIEAMLGTEENTGRIEIPSSVEGTLLLSNVSVEYEASGEITTYLGNEDAVGGMHLTFTVTGPSEVKDVMICGWFIDDVPSQQEIEEMISMMVEIWKEDVWYPNSSVTLPFESGQEHPVYSEDLGHTAYVLLVGLDQEMNAVGYSLVEESIPR